MLLEIGTAIVVLAVFLIFFFAINRVQKRSIASKSICDSKVELSSQHIDASSNTKRSKAKRKQSSSNSYSQNQSEGIANASSHKWFVCELKGHTGLVLDFDLSPNAKYIVSCGEDRAILLWHLSELQSKDRKSTRGNIEYDYAKHITFAPDGRSLLVSLAQQNYISVYKIVKNEQGTGHRIISCENVRFPAMHDTDIFAVGISCTGKWVLSADIKTQLFVWDLSGKILKTIDSHLGNNFHASVSQCGRFFGCSGFAPDVKVWQVLFDRQDNFVDVSRAFELKGHKSGVWCFDWNSDSSRMASCSRDGSWKIWDTRIHFAIGQDPLVLLQGHWDDIRSEQTYCALSEQSDALALACGSKMQVFRADTGQLETEINLESNAAQLRFSPSGADWLMVANGRSVKVFHNVLKHKVMLEHASSQLGLLNNDKSHKNAALRQRLQEQITIAQAKLKQILS